VEGGGLEDADGLAATQSFHLTVSPGALSPALSVGYNHSLALRGDGTVWAWGNNEAGQLGDGTLLPRLSPIQVPGLSDITAIAAGVYCSLALRDDGTVWAWGNNSEGELGGGTPSLLGRASPMPVSGLTGVTAISAGFHHSLAVLGEGTVWAWGGNTRGQLGDGTTLNRATPVQVPGLSGVISLGASYTYSLAAAGDGTVLSWGDNHAGELGFGVAETQVVPVQVALP
jgi:alpha-tubulin suppressor-like RCC1 family protein